MTTQLLKFVPCRVTEADRKNKRVRIRLVGFASPVEMAAAAGNFIEIDHELHPALLGNFPVVYLDMESEVGYIPSVQASKEAALLTIANLRRCDCGNYRKRTRQRCEACSSKAYSASHQDERVSFNMPTRSPYFRSEGHKENRRETKYGRD
jgi:hypothetical protein